MTSTNVVRIRRKGGIIVQDCDIYIGRAQNQGGWNLPASKWGNPFKIGVDGSLEEILRKYEAYVRSGPLWDQLEELQGKRLGCWCYNSTDTLSPLLHGKMPETGDRTIDSSISRFRCHGDVLIKLLKEKLHI